MLSFLATLAFLSSTVVSVNTNVNLTYASYEGVALPNGVTQWLGLRFAAPPLGQLRFAAPIDPYHEEGVQRADKHGPICLPTGSAEIMNGTSEDCLFLDVYAPSNASSNNEDLLPVFLFVQGGGFNVNSNPNLNGTGLVLGSDRNIVVVTINYRVGPYGFLASQEMVSNGSLNNGLKDQRKAMQWVQQHVSAFGGNPQHVVLGGDSAGAESITFHLTAFGGRDDGLFHGTAAESQGFVPTRNSSQSQFMYDALVHRANCSSNVDTLACLRNLTAAQMQEINFNIPFPGAAAPPGYMYGPTLDYDLITDYTHRAFAEGKYIKLPCIWGDVTNEGTRFTPPATNSIEQSDTYIKDQYSTITNQQLQTINHLYPNKHLPQFNGTGRFWRQVSDAYGDLRFLCPGLFISSAYYQAGGDSPSLWNYHWDVEDPTQVAQGLGVPHTVELNAIWGATNIYNQASVPASYFQGGMNYAVGEQIQAYWISFIRSYNPNTHRAQESPMWTEFGSTYRQREPAQVGQARQRKQNRLRFQTYNTTMEQVSTAQITKCVALSEMWLQLLQ